MADGFGWAATPSRAALPVIIDAEAAVAHRGWCAARDAVLRAVAAGPRLILILGGSGSGKSLLLRALAARLRDDFDVLLLERGDRWLAGGAADGRRRVVLVDQAWRLNEAALGGLARLGDCTVVLTGLRDRTAGAGLSDAAARVVTLAPIGEDEVGGYVAERLARAGLPGALFSTAAAAALAARAGGQLRRFNMLMSAALEVAREHGAAGVGRLEVEQAAARLDRPDLAAPAVLPMAVGRDPGARGEPVVPGISRRGLAAAAAGLALVGVTAAWLARPARTALLAPMMTTPAMRAPLAGLPQLAAPPALEAAPGSGVLPPHLAEVDVALPMAAPARVVVLLGRGDAAAAARAAGLATTLAARGFVVETRVVRSLGAEIGARYFFAEDRGTAEAVLAAAGVAGRSRQGAPGEAEAGLRPGLIELVLPAGGEPAVGETRTTLVQTNIGGRVP